MFKGIKEIFIVFITSFLIISCGGVDNESSSESESGDTTETVEDYGFKVSIPFCTQEDSIISCDLIVENISNQDQEFYLGLNQLMIDQYGDDYSRVSIYRNGELLYPAGSNNGSALRALVLTNLPRTYTLRFLNIDTNVQRSYIPRISSDWIDDRCFTRFSSCPIIEISNISIN